MIITLAPRVVAASLLCTLFHVVPPAPASVSFQVNKSDQVTLQSKHLWEFLRARNMKQPKPVDLKCSLSSYMSSTFHHPHTGTHAPPEPAPDHLRASGACSAGYAFISHLRNDSFWASGKELFDLYLHEWHFNGIAILFLHNWLPHPVE